LLITTSLFFGGVIFDPKKARHNTPASIPPDSSTKSISTKMHGKIQHIDTIIATQIDRAGARAIRRSVQYPRVIFSASSV
jgi:hypothetical protein